MGSSGPLCVVQQIARKISRSLALPSTSQKKLVLGGLARARRVTILRVTFGSPEQIDSTGHFAEMRMIFEGFGVAGW